MVAGKGRGVAGCFIPRAYSPALIAGRGHRSQASGVGCATVRFWADGVRKIAPRGCARCQTSQRDFAHPTARGRHQPRLEPREFVIEPDAQNMIVEAYAAGAIDEWPRRRAEIGGVAEIGVE